MQAVKYNLKYGATTKYLNSDYLSKTQNSKEISRLKNSGHKGQSIKL